MALLLSLDLLGLVPWILNPLSLEVDGSRGLQLALRLRFDLHESFLEGLSDFRGQLRIGLTVGHAQLVRLLNGLLYRIVMAKALPLGIHRVHRAAWEKALFDELLPVHLVFVLP